MILEVRKNFNIRKSMFLVLKSHAVLLEGFGVCLSNGNNNYHHIIVASFQTKSKKEYDEASFSLIFFIKQK